MKDRRLSSQGLTRREFLKVSGISAAAIGLTGCGSLFSSDDGSGSGQGNTLTINLGAEIPNLDSSTVEDIISFNLLAAFNEGLYRLDDNDMPVPAMAQDVEISANDTVYTFTLRDGIQWSNGESVTSQDFRYSWLRTLDPETAAPYSYLISDYVEGAADFNSEEGSRESVAIETPDDKTLEVRLVEPVPYFLTLTTLPFYYPLNQAFVEEQGEDYALNADSILYNGPYTMTEFDAAEGATLQKRDDYWDAENVGVQTINAQIIKEATTALNLYESGELHRTVLNAEQVDEFQDSEEFSTRLSSVSWNMYPNLSDEIMANENIRRALQTGIDREALTAEVLNDGSEVLGGVVTTTIAGPSEEETFREFAGSVTPEFDPERAREYWQAGVEELGEEPTITVLVSDTSTYRDIATFLQSQFQDNFGAQMEIDLQPFDARIQQVSEGNFQLALWGWFADYNDPSSHLGLWRSDSNYNYCSFESGAYDRALQQAAEETDPAVRMDHLAEAERILVEEEAATAPLHTEGEAILTKPEVTKYVTHPFGPSLDLKYAELE